MLWPNHDDQYLSSMTLSAVTSDGVALEQIDGEPNGVAQRFALPAPLAPGATLDVSTAFSIEALPGIDKSGAARFGLTNDVLLAPTFYPLVPRRIGGDWDTQLAVPGGDTTNSDSATFVYVVHAPAEDAIMWGAGSCWTNVSTATRGRRRWWLRRCATWPWSSVRSRARRSRSTA